MASSELKVIIVGGSIAGLTLAHCLERAGIKYVVLEKGSDPAPQVGASIGILPNGARILDQLQLYDEVESHIEPLETATMCYPDGFIFHSSYPKLIHQRFGYPIMFLDRQKLLEILYNRLSNRENIHLNRRVVGVERFPGGATVTTADGTRYTGHLVLGADGVHSPVRAEIWKAAQGKIGLKEKTNMAVEYRCLFGISSPIQGLEVGNQINAFFDHATIVTIHGKNGRFYWFLIEKLARRYVYPDVPRFTEKDMASVASQYRERRFYQDITFGQVWDARETVSMTALEENVFATWHHGRMALLGDSVHKMTPNIGQGANMAIEDAAVITDLLIDCTRTTQKPPTDSQVKSIFDQYRRIRYDRVQTVYQTSRFLVRFQARDGLFNTLFGRYFVPHAGDLPADMASKTIAAGEVCQFLPVPARGGHGWQAYRPRGWTSRQLGFLVLLLVSVLVMVVLHSGVSRYIFPLWW
ncbi:FAD/NAD(P)-binding domain-containing protein [Aspergillus campestris IBT 28561]|uniref:FAD/NAD(P)-binding domain-containing protein n=1 Tax=Aspergillus campestris (strain IBT 28561) TaxID=1392248 RepID=A0A2I1CWH6_ASPC2|nr:FAD/NAD(P)-binding domain-containing protein [Aspergillus campestris IBT 28561]PKY01965.1 FAD/NAD(P)-binding domain-containing protein [Aspergillus campestris IBT 28561]